MSATVRRLVCDVPLRWLLVIALVATAILVMDVNGLLGPMPRVALGFLVALGPMALSQTSLKLPVWRLLPVSQRQIARARWWLSVGGPLALLVAGLAVALAVVEAMGLLRATPAQIAALLGGECALALAVPVTSVAGGLGVRMTGLITLLWVTILAALAFSRLGSNFGLAAGAVILAGAAAAYLFPRTALLEAPAGPPRRQAGAGRRGHMKGWATLSRPFLIDAAVFAVSSIGVFVVMRMMTQQTNPLRDAGAAAMGVGMLALAPTAFGARIRQSARSLRLVPVSGLALASILVGAVASIQLLAFAAFYLFCRLSHGPADQVLVLLPLVSGAGACVLGLTLRGWWQATIVLWPVFALVSALLVDWPAFAAVSVALGMASLAAGWWWAHFELTRGSHVYRPGPMTVVTWRGR
jgi:hypothetical protein